MSKKLPFCVLKRKKESMQQVAQNLALNKCPHGFPAGTCPICSGHGGASRDKNKPRVAGEMSYNECMAAWIKIQAAKEAKIQERIDKFEAAQQRLIFNRIMAGLVEKVNKISSIVEKVVQNTPQIIKTPVIVVVQAVVRVVSTVINITINMANFINSVGEKLASVYGEVKNFVSTQLEKKIKKPFKIFLSFFTQTSEEDEEDKKKIEDLLKRIKNAVKLKRKKKDKHNAPN